MIKKSKFVFILAALLNVTFGQAVAKEGRGDDLVAIYNVSYDRAPQSGLSAMISTNKIPTFALPPLLSLDDPQCAGVKIWTCNFINASRTTVSNQKWVGIAKNWPGSVKAADTNGDGKDELIANYSDGIWLISNIATGTPRWAKILSVGREVDIADLNGNGKAELIAGDFTPGLQVRMDNGKWVKLTNVPVESFSVFNLDGKYRDDLVTILSNKAGLYIKRKNQSWLKIHSRTPLNFWRADIDGDGKDNIVANFGLGLGTYVWKVNGKWVKIWAGSPTHIEPADVNGNGKDDLVFYINNNQTSIRLDNGKWTLLHKGLTRVLAAGDIDGNGKDDLVFSFGIAYKTSTWAWMNNSQWAEVTDGEALGNLKGHPTSGACGGAGGNSCGWQPDSGFVRNTYTFANLDGR